MKKVFLSILLVISMLAINALTLADLDFEEQLVVKDYVISLDDELNYANVEDFEGISYNVIFEATEYIIVEINGKYYIVPKE